VWFKAMVLRGGVMMLESEGQPAIQDAQASDAYAAVSGLALPGHSHVLTGLHGDSTPKR
jgi:hypothetical protein